MTPMRYSRAPLTGDSINNTNVYAEVRGKYARPAPALNYSPMMTGDSNIFTPKQNPIVKRPSTAGSLVSNRSRSVASSGKKRQDVVVRPTPPKRHMP
mmetsp:Transcript_33448/g.6061  ORF Transcript_33448/g.6061 Transcript_33448/m.6061 type:complete len:97 (+) Transcript_33448:218-508(+)